MFTISQRYLPYSSELTLWQDVMLPYRSRNSESMYSVHEEERMSGAAQIGLDFSLSKDSF